MPTTDPRYEKLATESIPQYQERVKQYYSPPTTSTPTAPTQEPTAPIARTIVDEPADPVETFANTFRTPETREQIQERMRRETQGLIDSLNRQHDDEVAEKRKIGDERLAQDNAISVLSGLMGSTVAGHTRTKTMEANAKEIEAVNNKRALELAKVYTKISSDAEVEAREQLADATRSADAVLARRKAAQDSAIENMKAISSSGVVDFDAFASDPKNKKVYDYALKATGSEQALRAMFMLNRPKDQLIGTPQRIGNKYVQAYQNPITGKISYEQLELPFDLPTEYKTFQQMGDNLVAIPDNWDGDVSKLKTVGSTRSKSDDLQDEYMRAQINKMNADTSKVYADTVKDSTAKKGTNDAMVKRTGEIRTLINEIKNSGTIDTITGKWEWRNKLPGERQDTLAKVQRLKSLLTIDSIKDFKGLGAMSDREFGTAASAATAINIDESGKIPMTSGGFVDELDRIDSSMDLIQRDAGANTAAAPAASSDLRSIATSKGYDYDAMRRDGFSDEQIRAALGQ